MEERNEKDERRTEMKRTREESGVRRLRDGIYEDSCFQRDW